MSDTENFNASGPAADAFAGTRKAFESMGDPEAVRNAQAAMGMDPAHLAEALRTMTERSVEQSRQAYSRMKSAADEATRALESTVESAHAGSASLSRTAIDALRTHAEMGFSHLERLASAKTVAEMIELQTGYVRRQVELAADQAKAMQSLSQSVAQDLLRPGREAMGKAVDPTRG